MREVGYRALTPEEQEEALRAAGLPQETAGFVVALDASIAQGALDVGDHGISALTGRPTTSLAGYVHALLSR